MTAEISRSGSQDEIMAPAALGAAIRERRRSHHLTQSELAGLAGTGVRFVSELERGKPGAEIGKIMDVLAVLGLRLQVVEASP